jgi:glycosyltransferase involved in cell wall biosynthesis
MENQPMPLVSIIMNCYNSSLYLEEAITSVLNQTYENWELIFWDNQSTDSSASIFHKYKDSRLKYFYASEHTPLGKARNLAIEKTNGEFIAFLDCDDLWVSTKLQDQISAITNNKIGVVYTPFEIMDETEDVKHSQQVVYYESLKYKGHGPQNLYNKLLYANYIIFSSVLIKKEILINAGKINETLRQNEDYELLLKCSLLSLFVCTNKCGVKYRVHQSNNSHLNGECNFIENRLIYNNLPFSKVLQEAKKRNEIRYAIFNFRYLKKRKEGILLFVRNFSLSILFELILKKFGE